MKAQEGLDWYHSYSRRAVEVIVQVQTPVGNFRGINHTHQFNRWLMGPREDWTHRRRRIPIAHARNLTMVLRS
jgi:hypothetical protein